MTNELQQAKITHLANLYQAGNVKASVKYIEKERLSLIEKGANEYEALDKTYDLHVAAIRTKPIIT